MPVKPTLCFACALVLSAVTAPGAFAASPTQPRCNPDWTWEGQSKSNSGYSDNLDQPFKLKNAGVRAEPEILMALLDPGANRELRSPALSAIFYCNFRETQAELEALLADPVYKDLQRLLAVGLLEWGSEKARAHLQGIVTDLSRSDLDRLTWYPEHVKHGGDCDLDFLRRTVKSKDPAVRLSATDVVAALLTRPAYQEDTLVLLKALLGDPEAMVRFRALRSLYRAAYSSRRADLCLLIEGVAQRNEATEMRLEAAKLFERLQRREKCSGAVPKARKAT